MIRKGRDQWLQLTGNQTASASASDQSDTDDSQASSCAAADISGLWLQDKASDVTIVLMQHEGKRTCGTCTSDSKGNSDMHMNQHDPSSFSHNKCFYCTQSKCSNKGPTRTDCEREQDDQKLEVSSPFIFPACATVLPLRKRFLSTASWHFEKVFSKRHGDYCRSCKVSTIVLQTDEQEAAFHVLKYIYTRELPSDSGDASLRKSHGMLLMMILKVADGWGVHSCMDACDVALLNSPDWITQFRPFIALEPPFNSPAFQKLQRKAETRFLEKFCDATKVFACPFRLHEFKQQPYSFMLALLRDERLCTDKEATVLLLLRAWYLHNSQTCSSSQLSELKREVRYGCLHPFYMFVAMPHMPDLGLTREEERELWMMQSTLIRNIPKKRAAAYSSHCPETWLKSERPKPDGYSPIIKLRLSIPQAVLLEHAFAVTEMGKGGLEPATRIVSDPTFANGFEWRLFMASETASSAFSVGVIVKLPFSDAMTVTQRCSFSIKALRRSCENPLLLCDASKALIRGEASLQDRYGTAGAVLAGDASLKPWRDYILEGNLLIKGSVTCLKESRMDKSVYEPDSGEEEEQDEDEGGTESTDEDEQ